MLHHLKEFFYPGTVSEALEILERHGARAAVVAGGTTLGRMDDPKIEACVDITRLGLGFIKEDRVSLRLGATATLDAMARSKKLRGFAGGLLARAAASQPSRLLRNGMTLGGALVLSNPWSGLPPALLALDAQMIVAGEMERIIPAEEFVKDARYRLLGRSEILTEIRVPRTMADWKGGHEAFARSQSDPAMAIATVLLQEGRGGICLGARIVLGGICRRATRSLVAERKLAGKKPTPANFEQAARAAMKDLDVVSDWRAGKDYRVQMAQILLRRTLAAAWSGGEGDER